MLSTFQEIYSTQFFKKNDPYWTTIPQLEVNSSTFNPKTGFYIALTPLPAGL